MHIVIWGGFVGDLSSRVGTVKVTVELCNSQKEKTLFSLAVLHHVLFLLHDCASLAFEHLCMNIGLH